jgi:catechol 2,3-dioxygenase-like lactoylglutathione lyase family enzyme
MEARLSYREARDRRVTATAGGYARTASTDADRDVAAARAFYEDVLQGGQVWPNGRTATEAGLWFLVGGTLVEARAAVDADRPPITLAVETPDTIGARCWDAGFAVRVHHGASGPPVLSVIDPFGQEIVLACRGSGRAGAGG